MITVTCTESIGSFDYKTGKQVEPVFSKYKASFLLKNITAFIERELDDKVKYAVVVGKNWFYLADKQEFDRVKEQYAKEMKND